ncbi:MAG: hypothetical protein U9P72_12180 [Campylobacterota bacterium]|nr:hypothetical protein [Campylobacterota bacterium]
MNSRTLHHKLSILKLLYDTGMRVTASQLSISNANQYLIPLEELKLISRVEVPRENSSPYKVGFVDATTRKKAKEFLQKHNRLNGETPFKILNDNYVAKGDKN